MYSRVRAFTLHVRCTIYWLIVSKKDNVTLRDGKLSLAGVDSLTLAAVDSSLLLMAVDSSVLLTAVDSELETICCRAVLMQPSLF